ncbi:MAG TPA: TIGR03435 family protein [Bryobacteraceae bacterium]|nr:TIGR03435 family protein [Bryobacteraceae bacterium]
MKNATILSRARQQAVIFQRTHNRFRPALAEAPLGYGRRILLGTAWFAAVAGPVSMGFLYVPVGRAQSMEGQQPSFDVASVKPSHPPAGGNGANYRMSGGPRTKDPSLFACENFDLAALIEMAYDVPYYLLSAPAWTADTRFDIVARVPEGATKEQFRLMQQRLLIERFRLVVHREKREMPVFELIVARGGPKLKDTSAQPIQKSHDPATTSPLKTDAEGFPILPPGQTTYAIARGRARLRAAGETMEHFASTLAGQLNEPVIDGTGLRGKYDFILSWLPTDFPGDGDTAPTLFVALRNQLGLTLKRTRRQVEMLVVDRVEKTPTEN